MAVCVSNRKMIQSSGLLEGETGYIIAARVAGQPAAEEFVYALMDQRELAARAPATLRTPVAR